MLDLIAKQTGAKGSKTLYIGNDNNRSWPTAGVTLYLLGVLGEGETVKIQFYDEDAATWRDMYVDDNLVELTNTDNAKTLYGALEFRAYKTITAASVGVGISQIKGLAV